VRIVNNKEIFTRERVGTNRVDESTEFIPVQEAREPRHPAKLFDEVNRQMGLAAPTGTNDESESKSVRRADRAAVIDDRTDTTVPE